MSIFKGCNCKGACQCQSTNCDLLQLVNEDGRLSIVKSGDYIYKINLTTSLTGALQNNFVSSGTVQVTGNGSTIAPFTPNVKISAISGNILTVYPDGLAVLGGTGGSVSETPNNGIDSDTIDLTLSGANNRTIRADVKLSSTAGNQITTFPDGLYVNATVFDEADARNAITANAPLTYSSSTGILGIQQASGIQSGFLTSSDWNLFNSKQAAISFQNVTAASSKVILSGGAIGAVKNAFTIDIDESNINLSSLGGVLPASKGGTGLSVLGTALQLVRVNAAGTGLEFTSPTPAPVTSVFGRTGVVVASSGDYTTAQVTESGSLYFTNARARLALSAGTGISYDNTTGIISSSIDGSETKINAGTNITISGSGTIASPYVINSAVVGGGGENVLTFTTPLQRSVDTISILQSGTSSNGYLSSTNFNKFNDNLFLRATTAALRANATPDLNIPYFITDAGQEGMFKYDSTDTTSTEDGNPASGTIIVTAGSHRFKRVYDGRLDIRWFGGVADYAPSGSTMTGTNNTTALNKMYAAAIAGQRCYIGKGSWLFSTVPNVWTNSKRMWLEVDGNTFHPGINFVRVENLSDVQHVFIHRGLATGQLNIPALNPTTYAAGTGPNFDAMTGHFIDVEDSYKASFEVNYVEGFKSAIRVAGGTIDGSQEHTFKFKRLGRNKYGINLESTDGSSYCDKNYFFGGRISGDTPIFFNGNASGGSQTGSFRHNVFHNVLIENSINGIIGTGDITYNKFNCSSIEGGATTGVLSANKISLPTTAFANSFDGIETLSLSWLGSPGDQTSAYGTPFFTSNSVLAGTAAIGGISPGRMTIIGSNGLSNATRALLPANIDLITLLGISPTTSEKRPNQFASVKLSGIEQAVSYDGRVVSITALGTYTLVPPTGYVRVSAGVDPVVLLIDGTQIYDGSTFYIEQVGTGTIEIRRASDNVQFMPTTAIATTGTYFIRYFGAGSGVFTATKLGGTGLNSVTAVGAAPNANAATLASNNLTLQPASSTFPGVVTAGTQTFGGRKTFSPVVTTGPLTGTIFSPTITAAANGDTLIGVDILPILNDGGFTGIKNYGLRVTSILVTTPTLNVGSSLAPTPTGFTFTALNYPTTATRVDYAFSSGSATKDTYLRLDKTSVTSMGIANDGQDLIFATEKTTNGFIFRKGVGFASPDFTTGASTGTDLMRIWASGNISVASNIDQGLKFHVTGSIATTDRIFVGQLGADPVDLPYDGAIYYNTTTAQFRGLKAGVWSDLGSGSGGGTGTGDFSSNTTVSVDSELLLFSGTSGKIGKRATGTGFVKVVSGVFQTPASTINISTDTSAQLPVARISATGTLSATTFLRGDGQWATPAGGGGGGITSAVNFGGTPNANALTIDTALGTIQMNPASATQPGGVSIVGQTFAGNKTFTGTVIFKLGAIASGGAPIKFNTGSLLTSAPEAGAFEYDGQDLWITDISLNREKLLTTTNSGIVENKTIQNSTVAYNSGGRDMWEDSTPTSYTVGPLGVTGTGATVTGLSTNKNGWGKITLTTGTGSLSPGQLLTVTFNTAVSGAMAGCIPIISAGNNATSLLTGLFPVSGTTNTFIIQSFTALAASTTYVFYYHAKRIF